MRSADQVFRYGGEEFLVILPRADRTSARNAAERLRAAVESETAVTISLGVVSCHKDIPDKETLLGRADYALYLAKQNGRNRVEVAVR
jgi:diguanylate cyclase (GGDEF)-like protein